MLKFSDTCRSGKRLLPLCVGALICMISSCRSPEAGYSEVHSDSGIYGPQYSEIISEMDDLVSRSEGYASVINYGTTPQGRALNMVKLGSSDSSAERRLGVVITGAIHGDEFLDIAHKLPEYFLSQRDSGAVGAFFKAGGVIYVAPILNPDGYAARQRGNRRGADLNRDFPLKKQNFSGLKYIETAGLEKALRNEVDTENVKVSLTLDYHCCQGSLIYPWGYSKADRLPTAEETEYKRLAGILLQEFQGYKSGRVFDLLNYTALGGSSDWYHESFGAKAFTFEGVYQKEARQFDRHTRMWDSMLAELMFGADLEPITDEFSESSEIFLHLSNSAPGQTKDIAVSSPLASASRIVMCSGNAQSCAETESERLLDMTLGTMRGSAKIFKGKLAQPLLENTTYSFVAYSVGEKPAIFRSFRFKKQ